MTSTASFQKPENVLRRANEFISVSKHRDALGLLGDFLGQRKFRAWQPTHEKIIILFLDLCILLQEPHHAREGLLLYRNNTQTTNPQTLQKAIEHILDKTAEKLAEAVQHSESTMDSIGDVEAEESPEEILMSTVTADSSKDRTDRAVVVPWLRFSWDIHRQVLEVLKQAKRLESLYHKICARTFEFCLQHKRTNEFRRLCYVLRQHLDSMAQQLAKNDERFSQAALQMHLQTRFLQLQTAADLDMWPEAFRTVDDVYQIMDSMEYGPDIRLRAQLYDKLADIFWASESQLSHAYAVFRLFGVCAQTNQVLMEEQPTELSDEVRSKLATASLLSALAVPLVKVSAADDDQHFLDLEAESDSRKQLSTLLRLPANPSRAALLEELETRGVHSYAMAEARLLSEQLEAQPNPLELVTTVAPALRRLEQDERLGKYVPNLEQLVVQRLVQRLGSMFRSISLQYFESLTSQLSLSVHDIESLIVRSVKKGVLKVRIDHHARAMWLGEEAMESDRMRQQLAQLAERLNNVVRRIAPKKQTDLQLERKAHLFEAARRSAAKAPAVVAERMAVIEQRNAANAQRLEDEENARIQRLQEQEQERQRQEKARKEAAREQREREREAKLRLVEQRKKEEEERKLEKLRRQQEQQRRKLEEAKNRLNYITRALRTRVAERVARNADAKRNENVEYYEEMVGQKRAMEEQKHKASMEQKSRLLRVLPHLSAFQQDYIERHAPEHEENKRSMLEAARQQQLRQRIMRARKRKEEEEERQRQLAAEEAARREAEAAAARPKKYVPPARRKGMGEEGEGRQPPQQEGGGPGEAIPGSGSPAETETREWRRDGPEANAPAMTEAAQAPPPAEESATATSAAKKKKKKKKKQYNASEFSEVDEIGLQYEDRFFG